MFASNPALAERNNRTERVEIEGGIDSARLERMWTEARRVCLDRDYYEINEQRDLKTLVCAMGDMQMFVVFDDTGFTVRVQSTFARIPVLGGIFSRPRNDRRRMIEALMEAAEES